MKDWTDDIERVPIDSLEPHPDNPRDGDVPAIKRSIAANGSYAVLRVQRSTRYIVAGNNTWKALRELGHDGDVAVVWIDDDEAALRILADDNRASDTATYDEERRVSLLRMLDESDLLTGATTPNEAQALFKAFGPSESEGGLGSVPNGYLDAPEDEEPESGGSAPPRTRILTLVFERDVGERIERQLAAIIRDKGVDSYEDALAVLLDDQD